jgi:uncharacterized cupredoxin-like copper-binding protein
VADDPDVSPGRVGDADRTGATVAPLASNSTKESTVPVLSPPADRKPDELRADPIVSPLDRLPTDQELFDATIARNSRIVLPVLAAVGIFAALLMSAIAVVVASNHHTTTMTMAAPAASAVPAARAPQASTPTLVSLTVAGSNKRGPDGKLHDSFSKTNFAVRVGQPMRLRIDNKDGSPHTITALGTGVNITVRPGVHTYTMVATRAGRFEWVCVIPCDSDAGGWAMIHPGYMAGYITAT